MFSTKNLAQNEYIELIPSRERSQVAAIATIAATDPGAVFVIKIPITPVPSGSTTEWNAIGLFDGITQAAASNITGASKYGWTDVPGVERVRVYRTDASGGNGTVGLSVTNS